MLGWAGSWFNRSGTRNARYWIPSARSATRPSDTKHDPVTTVESAKTTSLGLGQNVDVLTPQGSYVTARGQGYSSTCRAWRGGTTAVVVAVA